MEQAEHKLTERQQKVCDIIVAMHNAPPGEHDKITLKAKSNPNSKHFRPQYLLYDIDNVIICFDNFAPSLGKIEQEEAYKIVIAAYFKNK